MVSLEGIDRERPRCHRDLHQREAGVAVEGGDEARISLGIYASPLVTR
jgi:hypothetical protein